MHTYRKYILNTPSTCYLLQTRNKEAKLYEMEYLYIINYTHVILTHRYIPVIYN